MKKYIPKGGKMTREVWEKQAKIDVLNELKTKAFDKDAFNGWAGPTYVVLVKEIDKLLKEYENGK